MPVVPRPTTIRSRARGAALTGVVVLVTGIVVTPTSASAEPTTSVPGTAVPAPTTAPHGAPGTGMQQSAAGPVTGVTARVTGADRITVTWDVTPGRGAATDRVTVCRVDAGRTTVVNARDCSATARAARSDGRHDDVTVLPGRTYAYAVLPDADTASDASPVATPVAVTAPRTSRTPRTSTVTPAAVAAAGAGSIAGRVTTTAGAPVSGANAVVIGYDYPNGVVVFGSATTGTDGRYTVSVTGTPTDSVQLCVDAAPAAGQPTGGWVSTCFGGGSWDGMAEDSPGGRYLDLTGGPALTGVDVALATGATVSGRVTAAGVGVAGASVLALGLSAFAAFRVRTGSDGRYVLRGVPAGVANLCVDARDAVVPAGRPGYAGQCADRQPWDGSTVPAAATRTTFTPGGRGTVGFALAAGGGLAGTVRSGDGTAVAGALVYVRAVGDNPLAPVFSNGGGLATTGGGTIAPDAVTGPDGRYRVTSLAPGRYVACVDPAAATAGTGSTGVVAACLGGSAPGGFPYGSPPAGAGRTTVAAGGLAAADVTLPVGGRVAGAVTDSRGAAIAGVHVLVSGAQPGTTGGEAVTGGDGRWSVTGLPTGPYAVCYEASTARGTSAPRGFVDACAGGAAWNGVGVPSSPAARLTVSAGASVATSVALGPAGAVTGTVTAGGTGVAGAAVSVWSRGSELPQRAVTAADGTYTVRGLGTGAALVCVDPDGRYGLGASSGLAPRCWRTAAWNGWSQPPAAAASVAVTVGATTKAVDLALARAATVTGRVTATDGAPLRDVRLQVTNNDGSGSGSTATAADGTYTVGGLTGASVQVCFLADDATGGSSTNGYLSECWRDVPFAGGSVPASATPVAVTPGAATTGIDAALAAGGSLAGTVRPLGSTTGVPFAGVLAFGPDGRRVGGVTALDGSFRLDGLAVGDWRVCATAAGDVGAAGAVATCAPSVGWSGGYYDPPPTSATTYAVTSAAVTSGAVVAVKAGGALAGTVRSDAGRGPLAGAAVVVFGAGDAVATSTTTAVDGTYRVASLPAGGYRVCVGTGQWTSGGPVGGSLAECRTDRPWDGVTYNGPAEGTVVDTVSAGVVTSGVDLSLAPGGGLTGTVTVQGASFGFQGVEVDVFDATTRTQVGRTYPSSDGSWLATGLTPGGYLVCVDPWFGPTSAVDTGVLPRCAGDVAWDGGYQPPADAATLTVAAGVLTTASVAVPRAAGVRGTVTDARGAPVSGVQYTVFASGGSAVGASADADGAFLIGGLAAGDYRVCVRSTAPGPRGGGYRPSCAGGVDWDPSGPPPAGAAVTTLALGSVAGPVAFTLADGASISGAVLDASSVTGLTWATVSVFDADGRRVASTLSDDTGAWRAPGLQPGSYAVCVDATYARGLSAAGYVDACWKNVSWGGDAVPGNVTRVTLGATSVVTGISPRVKRAAGIGGTVTSADSGTPVSGVHIVVFSGGSRRYDLGYVTTAFDGTYTVKGLAAGPYVVCFDASNATSTGAAAGFFGECRDGVRWDPRSELPSGTTATTVTAGVLQPGVDATLDQSAAISGTVTAASGHAPLGNAWVYVFTPSNGRQVGSASTSPAGSYRVGGLPAGKYVVCIDPSYAYGGSSAGGYRGQCYKNAAWQQYSAPPSDATVVATTAGTLRSGVSVSLAPAAAVTGTVTDEAGDVLTNAYVYLFQAGQAIRSISTWKGPFSFRGLAPGDYQVCVDARDATGGTSAGGYVSACYDGVVWSGGLGTDPAAAATTVSVVAGTTATTPFVLAAVGR